jgi:hypothetical protein
MKLKIKAAFVIEGALYEVRGFEETLVCFNSYVGVETVAGQKLQHKTFVSPGHVYYNDEEYRGNVVIASRPVAERHSLTRSCTRVKSTLLTGN